MMSPNEATVSNNDFGSILSYFNSVNAEHFHVGGHSFEPRTLKVHEIFIGATEGEVGAEFQPLRMQLIRNKNTWDNFTLNVGHEERCLSFLPDNTVEITRRPCRDSQGTILTDAVHLDEDGRRPRFDVKTGQRVMLKDEIQAFKEGRTIHTEIKELQHPVTLRSRLLKETQLFKLLLQLRKCLDFRFKKLDDNGDKFELSCLIPAIN